MSNHPGGSADASTVLDVSQMKLYCSFGDAGTSGDFFLHEILRHQAENLSLAFGKRWTGQRIQMLLLIGKTCSVKPQNLDTEQYILQPVKLLRHLQNAGGLADIKMLDVLRSQTSR